MTAPSILPDRFDWPSLIGSFLLNFGMLEHSVFVYSKDRLSEEEYVKVREWHLKDRLERIARHVVETNATPEQRADFAGMMKRLDPIRELRNHIAHGHMFLTFDAQSHQPTVTILKAKDLDIQDAPDCDRVRFGELLAANSELVEVIEKLQTMAGFSPATNVSDYANTEIR